MENVLCVKRKDWEEFLKLQGFSEVDYKSLRNFVSDYSFFVNREDAEADVNLKQIIPHCMVRENSKFYVCKRVGGVESRIREEFSIGFGGHIDDSDKGDLIEQGLLREIYEEIQIPLTKSDFIERLKFVGVTNDETQFVSSLHVGIWFECIINNDDIQVKESDKIEGVWLDRESIFKHKERFESWSRFLIEHII